MMEIRFVEDVDHLIVLNRNCQILVPGYIRCGEMTVEWKAIVIICIILA